MTFGKIEPLIIGAQSHRSMTVSGNAHLQVGLHQSWLDQPPDVLDLDGHHAISRAVMYPCCFRFAPIFVGHLAILFRNDVRSILR